MALATLTTPGDVGVLEIVHIAVFFFAILDAAVVNADHDVA